MSWSRFANFDQYAIRIDGSGRMTTCNRKFLRKYLPVQTTPLHLTIDDDLRHLAMLPHRQLKPTAPTPAQAEMSPQPSPAKPLTGQTPAATTPDHHSPGLKPNAPLMQLRHQPPTGIPLAPATPRTHASSPPADPPALSSQLKPSERPKKPPLALRRLQDLNSKGLLEQ